VCVCVYLCVCVRERDRERKSEDGNICLYRCIDRYIGIDVKIMYIIYIYVVTSGFLVVNVYWLYTYTHIYIYISTYTYI